LTALTKSAIIETAKATPQSAGVYIFGLFLKRRDRPKMQFLLKPHCFVVTASTSTYWTGVLAPPKTPVVGHE
jgi:hypothetical protein